MVSKRTASHFPRPQEKFDRKAILQIRLPGDRISAERFVSDPDGKTVSITLDFDCHCPLDGLQYPVLRQRLHVGANTKQSALMRSLCDTAQSRDQRAAGEVLGQC
jgi:hypothetical protein